MTQRPKTVIFGAGNVGSELVGLLHADHDLLLIDSRLPAHLEALKRRSPRLIFARADATNPEEVSQVLSQLHPEFKTPDVLVCTVGTFSKATPQTSLEAYRAEFDVNFFGNVVPIKCVLPGMIARRTGKIIVLSSTSGHHAPATLVAYGPSKWALENFCSALRSELAGTGVSLSVIAPTNLINKYSEVFSHNKGIDPAVVARKITHLLKAGKSGHYFIPGFYRLIHLVERLCPLVFDYVLGLRNVRGRRARYRAMRLSSVLITGVSSGLGRALAEVYVKEAATLYLLGRNAQILEKLRAELQAVSSRCEIRIAEVDLGNVPSIESFVQTVTGQKIDLVINNAGFHVHGTVLDTSLELYRKILATNFLGPVALTGHLLRGGSAPTKIINVLSTTAIAGRRFHSAYSASKAALWCFTGSLRRCLGGEIQVVEAIPATFQSSLFEKGIRANGQENDPGQVLSARLLSSGDVAERIYSAEKAGRERLLVPFEARIFLVLEAVVPGLFRKVFR